MFSGKSEEMIRRLCRAEIASQSVVIFKPRIDDRYDATDVVSHAGIRMRAMPVGSVAELVEHAEGFEVVGIDEAQFFEHAIVGAALALADGGAGANEQYEARCRDCHEAGTAEAGTALVTVAA